VLAPATKRRLAALLAAAVVSLAALAGCSQQPPPPAALKVTGPVPAQATRKLIRFAFAGPLSGPNAVYGQGMLRAVKLAVAQANKIPNVSYAGYRFEVVAYDDRSNNAAAVNVAKSIVADKDMAGVVGHFDSGCSVAASPIYAKANLLMVSVSSDPKLTEQGFANVFRMVARDSVQGAFAADLVTSDLGKRRVAVVDDSSTYGRNLADEFAGQLARDGGGVVLRAELPANTKDVSGVVARIGAAAPQATYFAGGYQLAARLSQRLKGAGINEPFIGGDTLFSQAYLEAAGGADADGDIATALGLPLGEQPGYSTFARLWKEAYPDVAPGAYDPYAFDSAWIVMDSVVGAGANADRSARIAYTRSHPFDNVTGQAVFDAKGDTSNQAVSASRIDKGAWVNIK